MKHITKPMDWAVSFLLVIAGLGILALCIKYCVLAIAAGLVSAIALLTKLAHILVFE